MRRQLILGLLVGLAALAAIIIGVFAYPRSTTVPLAATWLGITNVNGTPNAVLRFPGVGVVAPKNSFFIRRTYGVEVAFTVKDKDGATVKKFLDEGFPIRGGFPLGPTEFHVPFTTNTSAITFERAEGILGGYVDNRLLGVAPTPKQTRWRFVVPEFRP